MEPLTDRIASVSLPTVLMIVVGITAARVLLSLSRAAAGRSLSDLLESVLIAVVLVFLLLRPFVIQSFFIPSGSMHPTLWEGDHILVNKLIYRLRPPQHGEVVVFRAPPAAAPDEKDFIKRLIGLPGDRIEVREGFIQLGSGPRALLYTHSEIRDVLSLRRAVDAQFESGLKPLRLTGDAIWLGARKITKTEFAQAAGYPRRAVHIEPGKVFRNGRMLLECYIAEDSTYKWGPRTVPPGHYLVLGDNRNQSHDGRVWGWLPCDRVVGRADAVFWPPKNLKRIACP